MIPQMTMSTEHYNQLVRMIKHGVKPKIIQTQYHDEDLMGYNATSDFGFELISLLRVSGER